MHGRTPVGKVLFIKDWDIFLRGLSYINYPCRLSSSPILPGTRPSARKTLSDIRQTFPRISFTKRLVGNAQEPCPNLLLAYTPVSDWNAY